MKPPYTTFPYSPTTDPVVTSVNSMLPWKNTIYHLQMWIIVRWIFKNVRITWQSESRLRIPCNPFSRKGYSLRVRSKSVVNIRNQLILSSTIKLLTISNYRVHSHHRPLESSVLPLQFPSGHLVVNQFSSRSFQSQEPFPHQRDLPDAERTNSNLIYKFWFIKNLTH